jgi:hypothetical protein
MIEPNAGASALEGKVNATHPNMISFDDDEDAGHQVVLLLRCCHCIRTIKGRRPCLHHFRHARCNAPSLVQPLPDQGIVFECKIHRLASVLLLVSLLTISAKQLTNPIQLATIPRWHGYPRPGY